MRAQPRPSPWIVLSAALLASGACSGAARYDAAARVFVDGPARWLMMPDEAKEARGLRDNRQALVFIESFWKRRDPTPHDPENPVRTAFHERALAADRLYGEGNRRGSLTDRGHVLILFGSPSTLRYEQQAVPALKPDRQRSATEPSTRWMTQETWIYEPADWPPGFAELLPDDERRKPLAFVFAAELRRSYLLRGEHYLELAARAIAGEERD